MKRLLAAVLSLAVLLALARHVGPTRVAAASTPAAFVVETGITQVCTLPVGVCPRHVNAGVGQGNPNSVAQTADGSTLFIANGATVAQVATATNTLVRTIFTGNAVGVAVSSDGSTLYVTHGTGASYSVVDVTTGARHDIALPGPAYGIAASGANLYIMMAGPFGLFPPNSNSQALVLVPAGSGSPSCSTMLNTTFNIAGANQSFVQISPDGAAVLTDLIYAPNNNESELYALELGCSGNNGTGSGGLGTGSLRLLSSNFGQMFFASGSWIYSATVEFGVVANDLHGFETNSHNAPHMHIGDLPTTLQGLGVGGNNSLRAAMSVTPDGSTIVVTLNTTINSGAAWAIDVGTGHISDPFAFNGGGVSTVAIANSKPPDVVTWRLVFTGQPPPRTQPVAVGDPIPGLAVSVVDSNNTIVAGATALIHLALAANPGNASLRGVQAAAGVQPVNGVAVFTDVSVSEAAQGYTLRATDEDPSVAPAVSLPFNTTFFHLGFAQPPPHSIGAGRSLPPVKVDILLGSIRVDGNINPIAATALVTLELAPNPGNVQLGGLTAVSGKVSVNASGSEATFDSLQVLTPGTYRLVATSDVAISAKSTAFTVDTALTVTDNDTGTTFPLANPNASGFTPLPGDKTGTVLVNAAPAPVQVGDFLTIKGAGWDPNGGPLQLTWDGEEGLTAVPSDLGTQTVAVEADGTFTVHLQAPSEHRAAWTLNGTTGSSPQPACTANVSATQGSIQSNIPIAGSSSFYIPTLGISGVIASIRVDAIAEQVVSVDGSVAAGLSLRHGGPVPVVQVASGVQYLCAGEATAHNGLSDPQVDSNAFLATYAKIPNTANQSFQNNALQILNWLEAGSLRDSGMGVTVKGLPILPGAYTCAALTGGRFVTIGRVGADGNGNDTFGAEGPVGPACIDNPGPPPPKLGLSKQGQVVTSTDGDLTVSGISYAGGSLSIAGKLTLNNGVLEVDGDLRATGGVSGTGAIKANGKVEIVGQVDLTSDSVLALQATGGAYLYGTATSGSRTTLHAPSRAGASEVAVQSANAFFIGDIVAVNRGQPNEEDRIVTGFGSLLLNPPLLLAHQPGEQVVTLLTAKADLTPPTSAAIAASPPNAAGWYTRPVTVAISAQDNAGGFGVLISYYAVDNPACSQVALDRCAVYAGSSFQVAGQGRQTVIYFSADRAGNVEAARVLTINIDSTPPTTRLSQTGSDCAAQLTLTATDSTSGVDFVETRLDNGAWRRYIAPLTVFAGHTLDFRAHDVAGNVEVAQSFILPKSSRTRCPSPF